MLARQMPVNAAYYPMVHKASRMNGFIVGSLPRKKLGTKEGGKKLVQPGRALLSP